MMRKECLELIKAIGRYNIVISSMITLILIPLFGGGAGLFFLGTLCSFINFIINTYANNRISNMKNIFDGLLFIVSYVIRIGFVCGIAMLLVIRRDLFFLIFIAGYSAQLISITIYGLKLKIKEGI